MNSIKIALNKTTNKVIHIDNAQNGLSCNCVCPECGEKLEARQGQIRNWHFKHYVNTSCAGGQESALHKLIKQIILGSTQIILPKYGQIIYTNPKSEAWVLSKRTDVLVEVDGETVAIEIFVTHALSAEKINLFKTSKHKCIEINAADYSLDSYETLENDILNNASNKNIIYWEDAVEPEIDITKQRKFVPALLILLKNTVIIIFIGLETSLAKF